MLTIQGKFNNAKVFADSIDPLAHEQISTLCNTKAYEHSTIRIMPDVHAGAGCTIGTTMTINDKVCPNHVGVDIACGLSASKIGKDISQDFFKELDAFIKKAIPSGQNVHKEKNALFADKFLPRLKKVLSKKSLAFLNLDRAAKSLGSLGGGNHFIEVGKDTSQAYWLTVHSGSRNIGNQIADFYQKEAIQLCKDNIHNSLKYLSKKDLFDEYIAAMRIMQDYASSNRSIMLSTIMAHFGFVVRKKDAIETVHNYIDFSDKKQWILRKGAVSARLNELILIPLNMRDGILLAKGKGNADWNFSAPHGAGRLYSRQQAKAKFTLDAFKSSMKGIYSSCVVKSTLDEAPMAYKDKEEILKHIGETADIVDTIKTVYNFKA